MNTNLIKKLSPSQKTGQHFEKFAEKYLKNNGLKLVARNYNCRFGEIDLIMLDAKTLVFIEVRYRNNPQFGTALDSITPAKQQKVIKSAQHYLQTNNWANKLFCRFDALGIIGGDTQQKDRNLSYQVEWVKDAFSL
ncbi:MAG: YraN family protein [Pseudomonadales bacterium]|nr:YraN family protein [Pseudomonadales bacterium]